MTYPFEPITDETFAKLMSGVIICIDVGPCTLTRPGVSNRNRFMMDGPSGQHSLDASCTDLARLNAHWKGFNDYNAAAAALEAR